MLFDPFSAAVATLPMRRFIRVDAGWRGRGATDADELAAVIATFARGRRPSAGARRRNLAERPDGQPGFGCRHKHLGLNKINEIDARQLALFGRTRASSSTSSTGKS